MLYQAYQAHSDIMVPVRSLAGMAMRAIGQPLAGITDNAGAAQSHRRLRADRARRPHPRPPALPHRPARWSATARSRCTEEAAHVTPFGTLLHFKKDIDTAQPRVLLVAPLSGHFATLLRAPCARCCPSTTSTSPTGTTCATSPRQHGRFGFDDYIDHLIRFLEMIGPGAHVVAVCQPCVAVLAAVAVMAQRRQPGAAAQHDADGRADRHAASTRPR